MEILSYTDLDVAMTMTMTHLETMGRRFYMTLAFFSLPSFIHHGANNLAAKTLKKPPFLSRPSHLYFLTPFWDELEIRGLACPGARAVRVPV